MQDFAASQTPSAVAWAPDGSLVYFGNVGGPLSSALATNGTVRVGSFALERSTYDVGVSSDVRAVAASPDGTWVYAADGAGNITALSSLLWDNSAAHYHLPFDGAGGCYNASGSMAVPCPISLSLASPFRSIVFE